MNINYVEKAKVVINQNEVGYLMKKGIFEKVLEPGTYYYPAFLGYQVAIEEAIDRMLFLEVPYEILVKDPYFAAHTTRIQIEDGQAGFLYKNGIMIGFALEKDYVFWNVFDTYEVKTFDMKTPEDANMLTKDLRAVIPTKYCQRVCIEEGEIGLLYFDHKYQKQLEPGIYYYWNYTVEVTCNIIDMRWKELNIQGQEILTRDKVGIRLNICCTYRIEDPIALVTKVDKPEQQLYTYIQLITRELVGNYRLDEILEQKCQISEEIANKCMANAKSLFVEFSSVGIRDIILPGEIKDIMNTVLIAEKTAQANVITRREEVASTRSLLNTAKLMDENKTLYKLKELECIEKICAKVGEISVSGNAGLMEQLGTILAVK